MCFGTQIDMCVDMCIKDMCPDLCTGDRHFCRIAYRHVHRRRYRHAYRQVSAQTFGLCVDMRIDK